MGRTHVWLTGATLMYFADLTAPQAFEFGDDSAFECLNFRRAVATQIVRTVYVVD